mgnify:CR=1 FL=1
MNTKKLRERLQAEDSSSRKRPMSVLIRGFGEPNLTILAPAEFTKLGVDERYQRVRITGAVNDLIHVLTGGGTVPDPITIARRSDGSMWIVDGQQRFWAHYECQMPLQALVYDVFSLEDERKLFLIMNTKRHLSANTYVKSWSGLGAQILRDAATDKAHACFGAVAFVSSGSYPYSAFPMIRAMLAAATGTLPTGGVNWVLPRLDYAVQDGAAKDRATMVLTLIPLVAPKSAGQTHMLSLVAVGRVAYRRWQHGRAVIPSPKVYEGIKKLNWRAIAPSPAWRFLALIEAAIERKWPDAGVRGR